MSAIADPEYRKACVDGELESFCWYPLVRGRSGGHRKPGAKDFEFRADPVDQKAALGRLVAHIHALGGVDGLLGFSQGGELCYLLAEAIESLDDEARLRLRFIATFGSEDPFLQRGQKPSQVSARLSFLIVHGEGDEDAVHDAPSVRDMLAAAGAQRAELLAVAGLAHAVPKDRGTLSAVVSALQQAAGVEQSPPLRGIAHRMAQYPSRGAAVQPIAPMPTKWGEPPTGPREQPSGIIPLEEMTERLKPLREDCVDAYTLQQRREAASFASNLYCNNSLVADLWLVEGAVEALRHAAAQEWGAGVWSVLVKMGFSEYDPRPLPVDGVP